MNTRRYSFVCPLLRVAVLLIAGMLVGYYLITISQAWLWATTVCVVVALCVGRWKMVQSVAVSAAWLCLGGWLMAWSVEQTHVRLPQGYVSYEAVLTSEPVVRGKVVMVDMMVLDDTRPMKVKATLLRDTVGYQRWRNLQVGSGICACSRLVEPVNRPGATFDYAAYLREHDYCATTFIYKDDWVEAVVPLTSLSRLERTVLRAKRWRHQLLDHIGALGMEGQEYAVIAALTLGEKAFLSKQTRDDYSISGASHVLALSGLHLGIIFTLLTFLFARWQRRWLAQLLIMVLIWSYVVLVGFSPSVVRSASMLTVCALVALLERDSFSLNTLSLAAIVLLCIHPLTLFDIGFQMSFLAVLGILLFVPLISPMVPRPWLSQYRIVRWVWDMVAVSLAAQVLIFPLVAYHFGRFSCYFVLSNFVAIPCAMALLWGTVLLVPLSFVPMVGKLWAEVLIMIVKGMNGGLQWIASLPGASIEQIAWTKWQVLGIYLLIACLYWLVRFMLRHQMLSFPMERDDGDLIG